MSIIYHKSDENIVKGGSFGFDPMKVDALRQYEKHFSNLMYLDFFVRNPAATFKEKRQAELEMVTAKQKLKYWKRYCTAQGTESQIADAVARVKKQWS